MSSAQPDGVDLGAEGEELFDLLHTALAAGDGFELYFVCSPSDRVLDEIQRRLDSNPPAGNTLLWLIYGAARDLKNVLPDLLSESSPPEGRRAVWVRARGASDELAAAWTKALVVINEQRNRIIAQQPCALILAGPPQLALITQERAPDLWSVRSSVFLMPVSPTVGFQLPRDMHGILASGRAFAEDLREGEYYHNLAEALAGSRGKAEQISRFNLLLRASEAWTRTGALEKAFEAATQADNVARDRLKDDVSQARAFCTLGHVELRQSEYLKARCHTETALEHFLQAGEQTGEAATWHQLGSIDLEEGNFTDARRNFEKALEMRQAIGDRVGEAATWHNIATIDLKQGSYTDARRHTKTALEHFLQVGDRAGEAAAWHQLATIDLEEGNYADAWKNFAKALELLQAIGDRAGEAASLAQISTAAWELGRRDVAIRLASISHRILVAIGSADQHAVGKNLVVMADELGLDQEGIEAIRKEAAEHFQRDRGAALVNAAFGVA